MLAWGCAKAEPRGSVASDLIRVYVGVANGADPSLLNEVLAPSFERRGDPLSESATGIDGARELIQKMRLDMPDLHVELVEELYDGNRAAIRWRMTGTDSGPGDFPPTGRHVEAIGMSFFEVRDGKLDVEWTIVDGVSLLTQLGFRIDPPSVSR